VLRIDWQTSGAAGGWQVQLSPYAPSKPAKTASANLPDFVLKQFKDETQDAGFDSLGSALLGERGKGAR
jgi:hypothetical protein